MTTEDRIQKTGQNAPQTHTFEIPLSLSGFVAESTSFYLCVFPGPWGWALCGFVICAFVPLHLLPSFLCVLWALCGSECESIMQNKANFKMGKMALNPCCERHYGDISSLRPRQNKANQSRGRARGGPISNDQTQFQTQFSRAAGLSERGNG